MIETVIGYIQDFLIGMGVGAIIFYMAGYIGLRQRNKAIKEMMKRQTLYKKGE